MPWFRFIWDRRPGRNVDHLAEHGVTPEEAAHVVMHPTIVRANRHHPDRIFARGYTADGRLLGVSYVHRDEATIYVITAFDLE